MRRLAVLLVLGLVCAVSTNAQQSLKDAAATKEDIEKYFNVMHSREMMTKMVEAMSKPMHQMTHEQYLKNRDKLPADFEARMNKMMDDMMKSFPWDEMLDAMVPVYQKHLTKGDVDALVTFYSTPTGKKLLREMPAITQEAMESSMPLVLKHVDAMNQRVQQEIAQMMKDSTAKPDQNPKATPN
jgi:hypothetical protein